MINFTSVKFYTLTLVAVVNNFSPLITVLMAYFFLEEKMTKNTLIGLFFAFCGAIVLILGGENDDPVP